MESSQIQQLTIGPMAQWPLGHFLSLLITIGMDKHILHTVILLWIIAILFEKAKWKPLEMTLFQQKLSHRANGRNFRVIVKYLKYEKWWFSSDLYLIHHTSLYESMMHPGR